MVLRVVTPVRQAGLSLLPNRTYSALCFKTTALLSL